MDLEYLQDQHEFFFNLFKEHYLLLNERTQIRLDNTLYSLITPLQEKFDTRSEMQKLHCDGVMKTRLERMCRDLQSDLTNFTLEFINIFNKQYTQNLGLLMPAGKQFKVWDQLTPYFKENIERFTSDLKTVILTVGTMDEFSNLFPSALNKGKYHARLKTICYMSLLTAVNEFCNSILKYNNKKPMIINPDGATNFLKEENGFYVLHTPEGAEEKYIWEYSDQAILGRIPPSCYGSHELLFPAI